MGHCKTCKYYDAYECDHPKVGLNNRRDADALLASGYDAELYVGPDFGCIHHEEKANQEGK